MLLSLVNTLVNCEFRSVAFSVGFVIMLLFESIKGGMGDVDFIFRLMYA